MGRFLVVCLGLSLMGLPMPATAQTVQLYAAGSLKAVMTDITRDLESRSSGAIKIETTLGASGLLRERIEKGEIAHVFASADMGHPQRLHAQGKTEGLPAVFARNELCALVRPGFGVTTANLLERMLDAGVKLGTSTPKADPSGDYAFALFEKAEAVKAGAKAALEKKALLLTGGPTSEKAPGTRNLYGWVMEERKADVFLTYCTNAIIAKAEVPALEIVQIPKAINVGADYGLVVLKGAPPAAFELAAFIRTAPAKAALARHGFGAGD
jgi:molybdate transport system substrate-binding protein